MPAASALPSIIGAAGSLAGGAGSIMGATGGPQVPPKVNNILEDTKGYGSLPFYVGKDIQKGWLSGQLPLTMQRSLQALMPGIQAMYSGTMDDASMGANTAREEIARRRSINGITGPQMTMDLQRIDDMMRQIDLQGQRAAAIDYGSAVSRMYDNLTNEAIQGPKDYYGMNAGVSGGGSNFDRVAGGLQVGGNMLTQLSKNAMDIFNRPTGAAAHDTSWENGTYMSRPAG